MALSELCRQVALLINNIDSVCKIASKHARLVRGELGLRLGSALRKFSGPARSLATVADRQEVEVSHSDLVEIAKRTGEFKEHYGKWWGGFVQLSLADKAVGRRPFLWGGLITLGTVMGSVALKYGPALIGH